MFKNRLEKFWNYYVYKICNILDKEIKTQYKYAIKQEYAIFQNCYKVII